MKLLRNKLVQATLSVAGLLFAIIAIGTGSPIHNPAGDTVAPAKVSLDAPPDNSFAGEKVPTHDFEVRERLERELIRNVYFHSASIIEIKRAGRWKNEIISILRQYNIPDDFFYLCVAESQLSNAVSPAGAKGYWQFLESTGKNYGLVINNEVDERYDPIKSTHAAAKYLRDAHNVLKNWTLVAASYNMGVGGVQGELARQKVKNYYDLFLNYETSAYVFRVLAIKFILENPVKYGFDLRKDEIYSPIRYRTVKVDKNIDNLVDFALQCSTTYKMVKVMNAWILSDKLTANAGSTWAVQIPFTTDFTAEELMVNDSGAVVPLADTAKVDTAGK